MTTTSSAAWTPAPELGAGVYQLTHGPESHVHHYHLFCPFSPDGSRLLALAYRPGEEIAEVRTFDLATGEGRTLGQTRSWGEHTGAHQRWHDDHGTVIFQADRIRSHTPPDRVFRLVRDAEPDYADTITTEGSIFDSRPGCFFAVVSRPERDRDGVGLVDPQTGEVDLLCSVAEAVKMLGDPRDYDGLQLFMKMNVLHPRRPLGFFKLTNAMLDGLERGVSELFAIDLKSRRVRHVGPMVHHPYWHPSEPWIVSFCDDDQGRRRIAIDRLGDDRIDREFTPYFNQTGHPTFDPTGRLMAVDNYDRQPGWIHLDVLDMQRGCEVTTLATMRRTVYHRSGLPREDPPESLIDTGNFFAQNYRELLFRVQAHPAWDRTGRYLAFNSDHTRKAQVYVADLAETTLTSFA